MQRERSPLHLGQPPALSVLALLRARIDMTHFSTWLPSFPGSQRGPPDARARHSRRTGASSRPSGRARPHPRALCSLQVVVVPPRRCMPPKAGKRKATGPPAARARDEHTYNLGAPYGTIVGRTRATRTTSSERRRRSRPRSGRRREGRLNAPSTRTRTSWTGRTSSLRRRRTSSSR